MIQSDSDSESSSRKESLVLCSLYGGQRVLFSRTRIALLKCNRVVSSVHNNSTTLDFNHRVYGLQEGGKAMHMDEFLFSRSFADAVKNAQSINKTSFTFKKKTIPADGQVGPSGGSSNYLNAQRPPYTEKLNRTEREREREDGSDREAEADITMGGHRALSSRENGYYNLELE
ncbi:unnamed protein product [Callosobruchus maculatus]|uniref:Uncharacterized protein n=1 Tax=Callosobruchus maculatus TaxID=64391 RepID=A0A653BQ37_CALMS|nr:unnamed protein product [Callosobruchus maculatus]